MAFDPILSTEIEVGDFIVQDLMDKIKANFDYLNGLISGLDHFEVYNGSFELDADSSGVPDGWTLSLHPGGAGALDTGTHGAKCFKFTAPTGTSNGGGTLTSDYIAVGEFNSYGTVFVRWMAHRSAAATGIGAAVKIRTYDSAKAEIGSAKTIWTSTSIQNAPSTYFLFALSSTELPANTRFIRIVLEGGTVGPGVAGDVFFDGVSIQPQAPWNWKDNVGLSEQTTTSTTFANVGSLTLDMPGYFMSGVEVYAVFPLHIKTSSGSGIATARAEIGGVYSNEITVVGTTYQSFMIMIPFNPAFAASITCNIELKAGGAYTAYVQKQVQQTQLSLMMPGS